MQARRSRRLLFKTSVIAAVLAAFSIAGCGGDDSPRRAEVTWEPSARLPADVHHWWGEPVERYCDEDRDCHAGEHCRRMRLRTCPRCPLGEIAEVCVDSSGVVNDLEHAEAD